MSDDAFTRTEDSAALREKVRILQRHVDHLLGQTYHQIELIKLHRDRAALLEERARQLDEVRNQLMLLREEMAGRKQVELELRRRIEEQERSLKDQEHEVEAKARHIERLEGMLHRVWASPPRRAWRAVRRALGMRIGEGDPGP